MHRIQTILLLLLTLLVFKVGLSGCGDDSDRSADAAEDLAVGNVDTLVDGDDPAEAPDGSIRLDFPRPGAIIDGQRFTLTGIARTFENTVNFRILSADSSVLFEGHTTAEGDVGTYNPFQHTVEVPGGYRGPAYVEVFQYSARDGSMIDMMQVPIQLRGPSDGTTTLTIYLTNSIKNPNAANCSTVFAVKRKVEKTIAVAEAALEELLRGPTPLEARQGYASELPLGVRLQDIVVQDGIARADFSDDLNRLAGSCSVMSARAQIERTLKQFATVDSVVISIEGVDKGILQP
jgi:hypothetical protein